MPPASEGMCRKTASLDPYTHPVTPALRILPPRQLCALLRPSEQASIHGLRQDMTLDRVDHFGACLKSIR